jgi:hypothetical protein
MGRTEGSQLLWEEIGETAVLVSQFRRPEVKRQGVGRLDPSWDHEGESIPGDWWLLPSLPSLGLWPHHSSPSLHLLRASSFSACFSVPVSSSCRDTSHIGLESTLMTLS